MLQRSKFTLRKSSSLTKKELTRRVKPLLLRQLRRPKTVSLKNSLLLLSISSLLNSQNQVLRLLHRRLLSPKSMRILFKASLKLLRRKGLKPGRKTALRETEITEKEGKEVISKREDSSEVKDEVERVDVHTTEKEVTRRLTSLNTKRRKAKRPMLRTLSLVMIVQATRRLLK